MLGVFLLPPDSHKHTETRKGIVTIKIPVEKSFDKIYYQVNASF